MDPVKGLAGLIAAVRAAPGAPLRLDVYAAAAPGGEALEARLRAAAAPDPRIRFAGPLPPERVIGTIAGYDLLAVPSEVLETGPLVVLEAFAAGVPVLGSDLGGIAELVRAGTDGVLAAPGSLPAWRDALARLAGDPAGVDRLRAGVRPPRTMAAAAAEMEALYLRLAGRAVPAGAAAAEEAAR
jgi:glycosyltransferase involved in cell wall biosynthesis